MARKYRPKNFTEKMKWMDWKAKLIIFLKSQPGRNSVPLNYVITYNVAVIVQTNTNFLGGCVYSTPLTGRVFNADASKVHFYIARLIYENSVSELKILPHKYADDGCVD